MSKRKKDDGLCAFNHQFKMRITQREARAIVAGGFLPRSVADAMIAEVEALHQQSAGRERAAKAINGGDGLGP